MPRYLTTDVLVAVDGATVDLTADDQILAEALRHLGLNPTAQRWGEPVSRGANVLIRSTWDYVESPTRFASWLDHLEAQGARVFNPTDLLRWNMHKRYLLELDRAGVPTVPTELLEAGTEADLSEIMARRSWPDVVIKPAFGGTARHAIHLGRTGEAECRRRLDELLRREDLVIQPFMPTVTSHGEVSIVAIAGVPLLAVKKSAGPGDWRVQTDFGGTAEQTELTEELATLARAALRHVATSTAYARIDALRSEGGELHVIELELVEPELYFRFEPAIAYSLARHLRDEFTAPDAPSTRPTAEPSAASDRTPVRQQSATRAQATDGWTALASPTRRKIIELLSASPRAVSEIADFLPVTRPAVSQHLNEGVRDARSGGDPARTDSALDRSVACGLTSTRRGLRNASRTGLVLIAQAAAPAVGWSGTQVPRRTADARALLRVC